jgi:cytochrome c oxidase subunit 1
LNAFSSVSAFVLASSFLFFIANLVWSIFLDPKRASANPWDSLGLEWQTSTPVPPYNFERIPLILSDPYHYGEPEPVPVADLAGSLVLAAGTEGRA